MVCGGVYIGGVLLGVNGCRAVCNCTEHTKAERRIVGMEEFESAVNSNNCSFLFTFKNVPI